MNGLAVTYNSVKRKRFESSWSLSVYNVYARKIHTQSLSRNQKRIQAKRLPFKLRCLELYQLITYNFKF